MDQLKESQITQDVLYQEAIARNLTSDTVVQTRLILSERDALIESLLQQAQERTTDEVLKACITSTSFSSARTRSRPPTSSSTLRRQGDHRTAQGRRRLRGLAKLKSKDPSAKTNGGDLGSVSYMVKEFAGPPSPRSLGSWRSSQDPVRLPRHPGSREEG